MASLHLGGLYGYANGNTSYGYYNLYLEYSSIGRSGTTIYIYDARVAGYQNGSGYTTNTVYFDQLNIGGQNQSVSWSGKGSSYSSWGTTYKTMTITGVDRSTSSLTVAWWGHRQAQSWGAQSNSVTLSGVPTAGTGSYTHGVRNVTSTSATVYGSVSSNPYSYWRIHLYDINGAWKNYTTGSEVTYTQTGLSHNTSYNLYYQTTNLNDGEGSGLIAIPFTTSGDAPTINSVSPSPSRTTCSLSNNSVSYDTNASFSSVSIRYGTTTSYGSTSSSTSLSGLQPNTTYYYSMTVTDNWNRTSSAKTGSFKTICNSPSSLSISRTSSTTTGITISVSASGDTNAPITNYTLYYRIGTSGNYSSVNMGTSTSTTINNLSVDTNYQFYFTATNAGGTSTSSTVTYSTLLNNPAITNPMASNLTPFTVTISATGSISPSRTLQYRFSKDNGSTWTSYQSDNNYNWTNLTEETTYQMKVQVKATHIGINAIDTAMISDALSVTTLADQAKIRIKQNGQWVQGKTYYKINGTWTKAKKVYIKKNGQWVIGKND